MPPFTHPLNRFWSPTKRVLITVFFAWHGFVILVGGVGNTMDEAYAKPIREQLFYRVDWYTKLLGQNQQNWGFFSFVPNALVRFTFETYDRTTEQWTVLHEYKLPDAPYIGRHNEFNFLRTLAQEKGKHDNALRRYTQQRFCVQHGIKEQTVYLRKKYAYIPKPGEMDDFSWHTWEPDWQKFTMNEVQC